jgi:nucleotide-binding universal stress UspA family protein
MTSTEPENMDFDWPCLSLSAPRVAVKHILVPTDLRKESRNSIEYALWLARQFGARLTLLHVWDMPERIGGVPGALDPDYIKQDRYRAEAAFHNLHRQIRALYSATDCCFLIGDPCTLILSAARGFAADLIVISTRHYSWLSRLIGGSDAQRIVRQAGCPVLVVH